MSTLEWTSSPMWKPRLHHRRLLGKLFSGLCIFMTLIGLVVLVVLLVRVYLDGWHYVDRQFLTNPPSQLTPEKSGIKIALVGTFWLILATAVISIPVGVSAAVYLEEYATKNRFTRFVQLNIANLAGVPSIVYGILGLVVFVRTMHLGRSIASGALTMSLLILPVIIIAAREALTAVPKSMRLAAYGLGATRWQVVRYHVLPAALPGIMTGVILSLSRAIGEAAPLMMLGALSYVKFMPSSPLDQFMAMPLQIYNWSSQPQPIFHDLAAACIIVLLAVLFAMNAIAIGIRTWQQGKKTW